METRCHVLHNSLPLSVSLPLCFPSSSSVCRWCGSILWADWAALLSSTCLLNDSNYFPGLQATHACFISTSTSPICLHGNAYHTQWWNERRGTKRQQSILFLHILSFGSTPGPKASLLNWGCGVLGSYYI